MNTAQLESFVQVAETLNFRRAAQDLHLSQPTISKHISSLEEELGGSLFVRSTRSVRLTALGESFLPNAREILRLTYNSAEQAQKLTMGSLLTLGYSDPNELEYIAPALRSWHKKNRSSSVQLRLGDRDSNLDLLHRNRADVVLGFATRNFDLGEAVFLPITNDVLRCVVPASSPLAQKKKLTRTDVKDMPQVVCLPMSLRRRGYAAQGSIPTSTQTTHCFTTSEARCLVEAGFGYSLLPSVQIPREDSTICALPWEESPAAAYGVYVRKLENNPAVKHFIDELQKLHTS